MPVRVSDDRAFLSGVLSVEEAESLRDLLSCRPEAELDLSECDHLHHAALQVLLSAARPIARPPADPFLATFIMPELARRAGEPRGGTS